MPRGSEQLLGPLLRDVSRSFYLTLWILPKPIRPQIGLAYLLARTSDTIADTELVEVNKRLEALEALKQRILGRSRQPVDFGDLGPHQSVPVERTLLARVEEAIAVLDSFSSSDQQRIRDVLDTITSGQELDLRRFGGGSERGKATPLRALATDEELDDYTYRVAGCVGEFWTIMCRAHLFPDRPEDGGRLMQLGVRFGKGLQLVNILRDIPADLRRGRCYLPKDVLGTYRLAPQDLLDSSNESRVRPLYDTYLERAAAHLHAGWQYTNSLPAHLRRVRLACAWPILIGLETLQLLKKRPFLREDARVKVTRSRVRQIMLRSVLLLPFKERWRGMATQAAV